MNRSAGYEKSCRGNGKPRTGLGRKEQRFSGLKGLKGLRGIKVNFAVLPQFQ